MAQSIVPEAGRYLEPPEEIWDQLREAGYRPRTSDEFSGVSRWVDTNEQTIQLVHQAVGKTRFWLPVVPDEGDRSRVYSSAMGVGYVRTLARCVQARSMRMLAHSHIKECPGGLIAIRRLACLMMRRADFNQHHYAMRIAAGEFEAESELINSAQSPRQSERYVRLLSATDSYILPATIIGTHCRIETLSAVPLAHIEAGGDFDINVSMRMVNEFYDHWEATYTEAGNVESAAWVDAFEYISSHDDWLKQ